MERRFRRDWLMTLWPLGVLLFVAAFAGVIWPIVRNSEAGRPWLDGVGVRPFDELASHGVIVGFVVLQVARALATRLDERGVRQWTYLGRRSMRWESLRVVRCWALGVELVSVGRTVRVESSIWGGDERLLRDIRARAHWATIEAPAFSELPSPAHEKSMFAAAWLGGLLVVALLVELTLRLVYATTMLYGALIGTTLAAGIPWWPTFGRLAGDATPSWRSRLAIWATVSLVSLALLLVIVRWPRSALPGADVTLAGILAGLLCGTLLAVALLARVAARACNPGQRQPAAD